MTNNYWPTTATCTGFSAAAGPDQVWMIVVEAGHLLEVTMAPDPPFDAVLYLVTDCSQISATCLAGSDSPSPSTPEHVSWAAQATTTVFIIADGWSVNDHGSYTLDVAVSALETVDLSLHYMERMVWMDWYDTHEVLIGPGSSTNPLAASWVVLGDAADMYNTAANSQWARGLPFDISGWAGEQVRLAFRYKAAYGDIWRLDNLCIAADAFLEFTPQVCVWSQDFDGVTEPTLPAGWFTVAGPENTSARNWRTSSAYYFSAPNSAYSWYTDYDTVTLDRYLVSPPITLP